MRALVVYESTFGNTESIAQAIAAGLTEYLRSDVVEVDAVTDKALADYDLLVAGAPTQGFGLSRAASRENAAKQAGKGPAAGIGLREWLDSLPPARRGALAATFDTRFDKPRWLTGSAARAAAKRLDGHGYRLVVAPESFFVSHTEGPLQEGELERARAWGAQLGAVPTSSALGRNTA